MNVVCDFLKSSQHFVTSPDNNNECPRGYVYSIHARLLGGRGVHIERGFRLFFY